MTSLSSESIKQVKDFAKLQEICQTLIKIREKEADSKKKYHQAASVLQKEVESQKLENQCLQEKIDSLQAIIQNKLPNNLDGGVEALNQTNSIPPDYISKDEFEKMKSSLEFQIAQLKEQNQTLEATASHVAELQNKNLALQNDQSKMRLTIQELEHSLSTLQQTNIAYEKQISSGNSNNDALIQHIKTEEEQKDTKIKALESSLWEATNQINTLKEGLEKLHNIQVDYETLKEQHEKLRIQYEESQKEIIQKEEEKKTLVTILENNKTKAKNRIKKEKILSLQQSENLQKLEDELTALRNDSILLKQLQEEQEKLQSEHKELMDKYSNYDELNAQCEKQKKEIEELLPLKEIEANLSNQISDQEILLTEKENTLTKLKTLLQRSVKNETRNQEQISELQAEISMLNQKIASFSIQEANAGMAMIAKLENEKKELEQKLNSNEASQKLIAKNQKLNDMIEASNNLYTQLLEEHQKMLKPKQFLTSPVIEIFSNSSFNQKTQLVSKVSSPESEEMKMKRKKENADKKAKDAYLKRAILQYFTEETDQRLQLVPMILELIGCQKEQISAVMRQWERNRSFISRTTGFFGF